MTRAHAATVLLKATTMVRAPEEEITQQGDGSAAIRAAWDAFDAGKLETARHRSLTGVDHTLLISVRAIAHHHRNDRLTPRTAIDGAHGGAGIWRASICSRG